jgi:hypothetical protein
MEAVTPYDDLPIEVRRERWGWFGAEPWPSGICYDDEGRLLEEARKPFPAGESCLYCEEPFDEARGDRGQAMPFADKDGPRIVHVHIECSMRQVVGPLAHLEKRCSCYGGTDHATPGMTEREEVVEVWRRLREGTPYGH